MASLWNPKAKKWVAGRQNLFERLQQDIPPEKPVIWMHCASLGEFEQGRPVLEELHRRYPRYGVLLSFFSPSGFEVRKHYAGADYIYYLPMDSPGNASQWLDIVKPSLVLFVKYEYWWHYMRECRQRKIPLLLISAIFRDQQPFFKWYGGIFRKMLQMPEAIFVQDLDSKQKITSLTNPERIIVAGDTRFDRVWELLQRPEPLEIIEQFGENSQLLVAGSTWPDDEALLKKALDTCQAENLKLIIAPHQVSEEGIQRTERLFPDAIRYSRRTPDYAQARVLIIDSVGFLSRVYRYATVTYIGGGFNPSGIHNVLEAAVYGKPVLFGPAFEKFREARDLVRLGAGFPVHNEQELGSVLSRLLTDPAFLEKSGQVASTYVQGETGATQSIIGYVQEKRLLTS